MARALDGPLRILIVDDHEIVREGLRALFETVPSLCVVGEAATVADAIEAARALAPDVVVMDNRLGDGSGVTACRRIIEERPGTRVIILTAYADEIAAAAALRAGAAGYLLKRTTGDGLIQAVTGGSLEGIVDAGVLRRLVASSDDVAGRLTARERELAGLVAEGLTNADISARLRLPAATVKSQVSRLLARLGAAHRSEIGVRLAALQEREPEG
jgi:DNA-binding NarL/FixJ family response regulator